MEIEIKLQSSTERLLKSISGEKRDEKQIDGRRTSNIGQL